MDPRHLTTERLQLDEPSRLDIAELHRIYADERVWRHFPSLRFTRLEQTSTMLESWLDAWCRDGLGPWILRRPGESTILGNAGCAMRAGLFWNLGYRLHPDAQGHGLATEAAALAVRMAQQMDPDVPVVAYLVERNRGSARVAEKAGLSLVHRCIEAEDRSTHRLIFADRELDEATLEAATS